VQGDSGGTGGYPIFAVYNSNAAAMTGPVLQVSDADSSRTGTSYGIISAENAFSGTQPFYEAHNGANILFSLAQNSSSSPTAINLNLGKAGLAIGGINFYNVTSGSITLKPPTGALGSQTLTFPDNTGTVLSTASSIALSNLASQAANTVVGALTATTPSALAVPSCSTSASALTWTSGTGFGCNSIAALTESGYTSGTPLSAFSSSTNLTPATYSNVVALFASGSCSGFLKNDGTCSTSSGSASLDNISGAASQATGTETAAAHQYTWAGVETTATSPFNFTNANSTNNNASNAVTIGTTGSSTGAIPLIINEATAAGDLVDMYTGGTISNGTLSGGTLKLGIDKVGDLSLAGQIQSTANNTNLQVYGGIGTASVAGAAGGLQLQGSANSSTSSSAKGGFTVLSAGLLSNASPNAAALMGVVQVQEGYLKGSAIANLGDVVCGTTTQFTVTDCPLAAVNVIGIADTTSNPIGVITHGLALVKLDAAITAIGDVVCAPPASTGTAGLAHDNGTTACALGSALGTIVADSGTITIATGGTTTATAMSTTLVLVSLHISQ
jgi:hypothetical protein